MSIYYPGCPDVISDPVCSDCPPKELGDIRSMALVRTDQPFTDITDTAEWTTKINAKHAYIFPYTRGGLSVAPNETEGYGNTETDIDGYSYIANVFEPNYGGDWAFWNSVKSSKNYTLVWRTETYVHQSDNSVNIIPMAPITEGDKKARVRWNIQFKFEQEDLPRPYTTPTGVFDVCLDILLD